MEENILKPLEQVFLSLSFSELPRTESSSSMHFVWGTTVSNIQKDTENSSSLPQNIRMIFIKVINNYYK